MEKRESVDNKQECEVNKITELDAFLLNGSDLALSYFTGKWPMSQTGFEVCVREMIQLGYTQLYLAFTEDYREFQKTFNEKIDVLEKESKDNSLSLEKKADMWQEIVKKIEE